MYVLNRDAYAIKRFLHINKGIVVPFSKTGVHQTLKIDMVLVHKYLKTLVSKQYLMKIGNWQHAWLFLTEMGEKALKEQVGLPEEGLAEEQLEIKN